MDTCGTCRFWMPEHGNGSVGGFCRRYPPTVFMTMREIPLPGLKGGLAVRPPMQQQTVSTSVFPPMQRIGWCGEHQHNPALAATSEAAA